MNETLCMEGQKNSVLHLPITNLTVELSLQNLPILIKHSAQSSEVFASLKTFTMAGDPSRLANMRTKFSTWKFKKSRCE